MIDNDNYTLPPALYFLDKDDNKILCQFLHGMKMPDGFVSNIRRCVDVNACKVSGPKTHDYHVKGHTQCRELLLCTGSREGCQWQALPSRVQCEETATQTQDLPVIGSKTHDYHVIL